MNRMHNSKHDQRKNGRFSFLLEEWVYQLALVIVVVSAIVERGIALSGGGSIV
jgi:hypothetical protein